MIPLTIDSLYEYLINKSVDVKHQPETKQIYTLFKVQNEAFPLFIGLLNDEELLQLFAPIPIALESQTITEVARVLHLFNKEIDIPGFGLDERAKIVFYRTILPASDKKVAGEILCNYIHTIPLLIETFFPIIAAVVAGKARFIDVVKQGEAAKIRK
ncbi:YbjN domain-containing protein [Neochlamydia sp. S13]|uniref:YbjN domain-containing protein n=1 Tax=Neochlamydia sp. S13 TaxID=1353976 RepID=UPI000694E008|nr:YbjN domain-containing protein [Neochlamydia sp. S13]BBI16924.1 Uncharacterized protein NCS13_1_0729 [Neochlamydia sp. S13]